MVRAALPVTDASRASLRATVEDDLARRLWDTAVEGGREHDAIQRGFQSNRDFPCDRPPGHPLGIRLPALPEEAGGTLALGIVSTGASSRLAHGMNRKPSAFGAAKISV